MTTEEIFACTDLNKLRSWLDGSLKERDRVLRFIKESGILNEMLDKLLGGERMYSSIHNQGMVTMAEKDFFQ